MEDLMTKFELFDPDQHSGVMSICRHSKDDPSCSSNGGGGSYNYTPITPDAERYAITKCERMGPHLVLRVNYPNCSSCAYEGDKVLVFKNVTEMQALRWRKIDPHFRDPKKVPRETEAPSPAARFPANDDGWKDAIAYAASSR